MAPTQTLYTCKWVLAGLAERAVSELWNVQATSEPSPWPIWKERGLLCGAQRQYPFGSAQASECECSLAWNQVYGQN